MDMTLVDTIKMSKSSGTQGKRQPRALINKKKSLKNVAKDRSSKAQRFMDSKSSIRQGYLGQRRSHFQDNQFSLAIEIAKKVAVAPYSNGFLGRNREADSRTPRFGNPLGQRKAANRDFGTMVLTKIPTEPDIIPTAASDENSLQILDSEISNFEIERCGICMDIIIDRGVLDCCQHWFCFVCIDNWGTITNLCPLCQKEFQLITCIPVYDTLGTSKVDEDSLFRDDDWCIEGTSSTLSFPSYYIDENAVICLDGDGCKIRNGLANSGGDLVDLDTSIACDSCDIWYHAFCVGFDPESSSDGTWLCPRCITDEMNGEPQSFANSVLGTCNWDDRAYAAASQGLCGDGISRKMTVSVADAGETAVVVSMVVENQVEEGTIRNCVSTHGVDENIETEYGKSLEVVSQKVDSPSLKITSVQPILQEKNFEVSSLKDYSIGFPSSSFVLGGLNISYIDEAMAEPSSRVNVEMSKEFVDALHSEDKLFKEESKIGLQADSSVGMLMKVQEIEDMQQCSIVDESVSTDRNQEATGVMDIKEDLSCSDHRETTVPAKTVGVEGRNELIPLRNYASLSDSDVTHRCSTTTNVHTENSFKYEVKKEDVNVDIMGIVRDTKPWASKGNAILNSDDKSSEEQENVTGLRVKKIMRRSGENSNSSMLVEQLRKEIRDAVQNKSPQELDKTIFDTKLLAAFRAAVAGPKTDTDKKSPALAVKLKKSILQKGKTRDSLTKKIYGRNNGKRRRAWDRDCEIEFWKHRCIGPSKPEKIESLKSVLDHLRNYSEKESSDSAEGKLISQSSNPILSRLYLADTSVFPRKDDIKPLSALKPSFGSAKTEEVNLSEKGSGLSDGNVSIKLTETNIVMQKAVVSPLRNKGRKCSLSTSKENAVSSMANLDSHSEMAMASPSVISCTKTQKEVGDKSNNIKNDKRKWALQVLARKTASVGSNSSCQNQEDIKGLRNYPLLAQLPTDMRPVVRPCHHNRVPLSIRQEQLYRLTELLLRKTNLPAMRRTADTELAVADATNIEKEVADRSSSKLVYLNLCSQKILHHSKNSKTSGAVEKNHSSPSELPTIILEQAPAEPFTDSLIEEALKNAGLVSDSPPSSPSHRKEGPNLEISPSKKVDEEGSDDVIDSDFQQDLDIYGDFEYDLEDEDYVSVGAIKVPRLQSESESKMKVVFCTLKSLDMEDNESESPKDSLMLKNGTDESVKSSSADTNTVTSSPTLESSIGKEGQEPSLAEYEELYGPEKEPCIINTPDESRKGIDNAESVEEKKECGVGNSTQMKHSGLPISECETKENVTVVNSSGGQCTLEQTMKCSTDNNKPSENGHSVSTKVVAYIKEHIRPLCKSGVITTEQYRWAVLKATDKVMKYHSKDKNANFLIKEGEKVKKLAEQYVEAAQQKGKLDKS